MRLIDTEKLIKELDVEKKPYIPQYNSAMCQCIRIINAQPTVSPWREITDVDGLKIGQSIALVNANSHLSRRFPRMIHLTEENLVPELALEIHDSANGIDYWKTAKEWEFTHYMVIPQLEKEDIDE